MTASRLASALERLCVLGPLSVFVYGSAARGDMTPGSDAELGVVFDSPGRPGRRQLAEAVADEGVRCYPFTAAELREGRPDVPFPAPIWLHQMRSTARTLAGERVVETLELEPLQPRDGREGLAFQRGVAFAAHLALRTGDHLAAADMASKSALWGAAAFEVALGRPLPAGYREAARAASARGYGNVPARALAVREGLEPFEPGFVYDVISFLARLAS